MIIIHRWGRDWSGSEGLRAAAAAQYSIVEVFGLNSALKNKITSKY